MADTMNYSSFTFNFLPNKINDTDGEKIYLNTNLFTYKNRNNLISYINLVISFVLFILGIIFSLYSFQNNLDVSFTSVFNTILQLCSAVVIYGLLSIALRIDKKRLYSSSSILNFSKNLDAVIYLATILFLSINNYFPGIGSLGFFLISIHLVIKEFVKNHFQKYFIIRQENDTVICELLEYYPHPLAFINAKWIINLNEIKQFQFILYEHTIEKKFLIFYRKKTRPMTYDTFQGLLMSLHNEKGRIQFISYALKIVVHGNSKQNSILIEVIRTKNLLEIRNLFDELSNHTIPFELLLNTIN